MVVHFLFYMTWLILTSVSSKFHLFTFKLSALAPGNVSAISVVVFLRLHLDFFVGVAGISTHK